uniref:Interleukin-1 n=1 Tax=Terrapene triunguis TaxID=2587831 RepID=A0A674I7Y6_9SAUR
MSFPHRSISSPGLGTRGETTPQHDLVEWSGLGPGHSTSCRQVIAGWSRPRTHGAAGSGVTRPQPALLCSPGSRTLGEGGTAPQHSPAVGSGATWPQLSWTALLAGGSGWPGPLLTLGPAPCNNSFTHAETFIYKYTRSRLYTVQDEEHKSFVLWRHTGQAQLMAVHLQGPNSSEAVKLNLDLYRSPHISPKRISPVAMNIVESNAAENNLYLCCVKDKGSPVLQLEKVKGPMKDIRTGDQERFIFFKTSSGSTCSFESAAHPGWFLSTSKLNDKPIRMVNRTGDGNRYFGRVLISK